MVLLVLGLFKRIIYVNEGSFKVFVSIGSNNKFKSFAIMLIEPQQVNLTITFNSRYKFESQVVENDLNGKDHRAQYNDRRHHNFKVRNPCFPMSLGENSDNGKAQVSQLSKE